MRWRFGFSELVVTSTLASALLGACSRTAPLTPSSSVVSPPIEVSTVGTPGTRAAPVCVEGSKPSTAFVRKDWLGAYEFVKTATNVWVDGDEPSTAEAARDGLCLSTSGIVGMPPSLKTTCNGAYWIISTDHLYYTDHTFVIVPRGDQAVVFDAGQIGGGLCSGQQSSTLSSLDVSLNGDTLRIKASSESFEWSDTPPPPEQCQRSHTDIAEYSYDLRSGLACEVFRVE